MYRRFAVYLLLAVVALACATPALAQGCAMCAQNAAAQNARAQQALNNGILMLVGPTVLLFGGVFLVAYKRRN